jgi:hypothetical protein
MSLISERAHLVDLSQAGLELANLVRQLRVDAPQPLQPAWGVKPLDSTRRAHEADALDGMRIPLATHGVPFLGKLIELRGRQLALESVLDEFRCAIRRRLVLFARILCARTRRLSQIGIRHRTHSVDLVQAGLEKVEELLEGKGEDVVLVALHEGEREAEHGLDALGEDEVLDRVDELEREAIAAQAFSPLSGSTTWQTRT